MNNRIMWVTRNSIGGPVLVWNSKPTKLIGPVGAIFVREANADEPIEANDWFADALNITIDPGECRECKLNGSIIETHMGLVG